MDRRDFLKGLGIATGGAVVSGCGKRENAPLLVSPVSAPGEGTVPGKPVYVRSTCTECPANCGYLVKVIDGNAIKLEGTPGHPINDGALCMRGQASISRLYSPKRLRGPKMRAKNGRLRDISWEDAYEAITSALSATAPEPPGFFISGRTTGSLAALIDTFCNLAGIERAPEYEAFDYATVRRANQIVFGRYEIPWYDIANADFLLTLGAEVISTFVSPVSHAKQIQRAKESHSLKWVHIEPHATLEGMRATHRFVVRPGSEADLLNHLLNATGAADVAAATGLDAADIRKIASLMAEAARPLIIAGGASTSSDRGLEAAVAAARLQQRRGMEGVDFARAHDYQGVGTARDLQALSERIRSSGARVLFISRTDPILTAPHTNFADALDRATLVVGLADSIGYNRTLERCDIILPISHSLESWGDAAPRKGMLEIIQPAVEKPLHKTKAEGDILLDLIEKMGRPRPAPDFKQYLERRWAGAGVSSESLQAQGFAAAAPAAAAPAAPAAAFTPRPAASQAEGDRVLVLAPSIRTYDGRSRDIKLLSEIPDPLTTITYGDFVSVSQADAEGMGLEDGDHVRLSVDGWLLELPAKRQPQMPRGVYAVHRDTMGIPSLAIDERSGEALTLIRGLDVARAGGHTPLPVLAGSPSQHGRGIIPNPVHLEEHKHEHPSLYGPEHERYRWAMTVDLDKCTGCGACVAACYVENNVPMTGRDEHLVGREMSWLRIEPYYDKKNQAHFLPMLCQQCSNAPCEPVCPVFAAYHNPEGLNAQIYNRCVGTRYCANNCPYKVRRFNWFDHPPANYPLGAMQNPDVSVRGRGVMEKCTFCVQRIRSAKNEAKNENRQVRDGEVVPACAQTCPTEAILFGNKLDEQSRVARASHDERAYRVFDELGTDPAVTYLTYKSEGEEA